MLTRLADHYTVTKQVNEGRAAVVGGLVTGALAGLKADVLTGGFTLGGGMIAGGVLGALGAAGLARGYNMVRGTETVTVTWTDEVLNRLVASALLAYLAVAHYGRGRGQWAQSEHPAFWESTVRDVLIQQGANFTGFWRRRGTYTMQTLTEAVQTELTLAAERVLIRLYPEAVSAAAIGTENTRLSAEAQADAQRLLEAKALEAQWQAEQARRDAAEAAAREAAEASAASASAQESEAAQEAPAEAAQPSGDDMKPAPRVQAAQEAPIAAPPVSSPAASVTPLITPLITPLVSPLVAPLAATLVAPLAAQSAVPAADAAPDAARKQGPPPATRTQKRTTRSARRRRVRRGADVSDIAALPPAGAASTSS